MRQVLAIIVILLLMSKCWAQKGIDTKMLFKKQMNQRDCKIVAPEYLINDTYYYYYENFMYTFRNGQWCAKVANSKKLKLPDREDMDYRIINDSVAVFSLTNLYEVLYYCNFKSGTLIKLDTIVKNSHFHESNSEKYKLDRYEFTGGVFPSNKFYFLSARDNKSQKRLLFQVVLSDQKIDTIHTGFLFDNYIQTIKSSNKYLIVDGNKRNVFNLTTRTHQMLKSEIDFKYRLLDFINDEVVMLHHSKEPHKFALLNVVNGKSELFELDETIFRLENIREEEVLKVEDGPSDGMNKLKFRYFTCRNGENMILLSFADRNDNRIVYSLKFPQEILKKLN